MCTTGKNDVKPSSCNCGALPQGLQQVMDQDLINFVAWGSMSADFKKQSFE